MVVIQLRLSGDNFSYMVHGKGPEAVLVDPGFGGERGLEEAEIRGIEITHIILTHHHGDHTGDLRRLKGLSGARIIASRTDGKRMDPPPDIPVEDGDELYVGGIRLGIISTPGHTPGGICMKVDDEALITGDTLFIDDCGRCDLPGGSLEEMFDSLQRIKALPDHLVVYPGHDYGPKPYDTLGAQKKTNRTLRARDLEEFSRV